MHDGYKSRKFLGAAVGFVVIEFVAALAFLWLGKMSAAEWSSLNAWLFPSALTIFSVTSVADKKLQKDDSGVLK